MRWSWLMAVGVLGCGSEVEAPGRRPLLMVDAATVSDAGPRDVEGFADAMVDARPDSALEADVGADPADAMPDAMPDAAPPERPSTGLPFVAGPPPEQFDCTADFVDPGRRSPVPLDCVLDPDCHTPMVVAHRGAGGQFSTIAPENSLAALRAALLLGVDGVELDVRHTADDRLVLMHDADLERTTHGAGKVDDYTAAELAEVALKLPPRDDIPGDFDCERVPTLQDAFALTRGRLFIDLDTKTSRVDLVVAAIVEAGLVDEVFISVSSPDKAARARAIEPSIRVQVRPDTLDEYESTMALFERAPEIVEIPSDQIEVMGPLIHAAGQKVFADVWGYDVAAGLRMDVAGYLEPYAAGADIIQSEFAPLVLEALERR